jgi:hypothetical protein
MATKVSVLEFGVSGLVFAAAGKMKCSFVAGQLLVCSASLIGILRVK